MNNTKCRQEFIHLGFTILGYRLVARITVVLLNQA